MTKPSDETIKVSPDAHNRVAILFVVPPTLNKEKPKLVAISIKWLLAYGVPCNSEGEAFEYDSTHIIQ